MKVNDEETHVYEYDNLYQLTFVDYNDGNSTNYYYDALGNRTSVENDGPTYYALNDKGLNQYGQVADVNYLYDDNGNLEDVNNGQYICWYDCENHLGCFIDYTNSPSYDAYIYGYDYLGRRVSKEKFQDSSSKIKYCYDGDRVIAEYDVNDTLLRMYIYGAGIDEPICMSGNGGIYYYHYDGLGSVVALSNSSGYVVERYSYDVFGEPNRVSALENPYMFTGRRYDSETGLYYYRFRYYSPKIGRFLQTDPIGYYYSMNLYEYCWNNPTNWIDPYGLYGFGLGLFSGLVPSMMFDPPPGYDGSGTGGGSGVGSGGSGEGSSCKGSGSGFGDGSSGGFGGGSGGGGTSPSGFGYFDINVSGGYYGGISGGTMIGPKGIYPYFGGGIVSPPGGVAITKSIYGEASAGQNVGFQYGRWLGFQVGYSFNEGSFFDGNFFFEVGFVTPGASFVGFDSWGPFLKPDEDNN